MPTYEINGTDVEFDTEPTPADIDFAASQLGLTAEPEVGFARKAAATAVEIGAPVLGGIAGAPFGPAGVVAGGGLGGAAGRFAAEKIRGEDVTGRELLASGVVGAIPGGAAHRLIGKAGAGLAKRAVVHGAEGAVIGAGADIAQTGIETGELPTIGSVLKSAAGGATIGGALGGTFGKRAVRKAGGAAEEVADEAAAKAVTVNAVDEAVPPPPELPPRGQRQIVLPGESVPPRPGEPATLFDAKGRPIKSNIAPVLETTTSQPLSDTLRDDVMAQAEEAADALRKLSPELQKQRFFRQLGGAIKDGLFDPKGTLEVLQKNGWTMREFFESELEGTLSQFEEGASGAGRLLNRLKQEKARILAVLHEDPETRKIVDDLAVAGSEGNFFSKLWQEFRDLDDVGRASVTGQMATGQRNAVTQAGRLMLEVPKDVVQAAFEKLGFSTTMPAGNPLATLWGIGAASKPRDTEKVLSMLDKLGPEGEIIVRRLFGTSTSETPFIPGSKTGRPIRGLPRAMQRTFREGVRDRRIIRTVLGPVANALTAFNQLQENFFRRGAFQARLMQRAEQKGVKWAAVQENPGLLDPEDFEDALSHSLDISFANQPESEAGRMMLEFARFTQPLSTRFVTFARYVANYGKFFMDFNPAGSLRLLSPGREVEISKAIKAKSRLAHLRKEGTLTPGTEAKLRRVIKQAPKGSADVLAKAVTGTALLGAGTALRLSKHAGEKWYETKGGPVGPDGEPTERNNIVGLAGPFLPWTFLGELVARQIRDTPSPPMSGEDYAQGLAGLRLSPGTKALFDAVSKRQNAGEAIQTVLDRTVSEFIGMFSVPLRTIKDFAAEFGGESERLYLDPREVLEIGDHRTKLLNPTIQNVPGLGKALDRPAAVSAITGRPRAGERTGRRQLTGLTARTPTPIGTALDRLGISEFEVSPRTGNPKLDRELSVRTGALAQAVGNPFVQTQTFQQATPAEQKLLITKLFTGFRRKALDNLRRTNPELAAAKGIEDKFTELEKEVAKERGFDVDELIFQVTKRAPGR